MNERDKNSNFLAELTRRRVLQSAAAYIIFAWVVVQVGSIVFPEFSAPAWAMRALIIVLIVGFPPAMLLAWTLDISSRGLILTPDSGYLRTRGQWPRLLTLFVATAMSAGVLWWAWDDYIVQSGQRLERAAIKTQPVIAVNSPRQRIGTDDNAWLGDGVANLIRSELAESRHAIIISHSRWSTLTSEVENSGEIAVLARQLGIDYLIDGEYIETADGIVLTIFVEDLETGTEIYSSVVNQSDPAALIASMPEHGTGIKRALRIPHEESVGLFEADFATENISAYEAYIAGLDYWNSERYKAAEQAFGAALELAPNYNIARLRLAQVYEETGRTELAWTTLNDIPSDAELSERLKLYVAGAKAYFGANQDPEKAIDAYRHLVELYPYEFEARLYLALSYWLNFQDAEGIVQARQLTKLHAYDPNSWYQLSLRLLDFGELDEAEIAIEKYAAMRPDAADASMLLGDITRRQGVLTASVQHYLRALEIDPDSADATSGLARSRFLLGDIISAEQLWRASIDDENLTPTLRIDATFDLAYMYLGLGRYRDALNVLADTMPVIEEEGRRAALALSYQATIHYEFGNHERGHTLFAESLRIAPPPETIYFFGRGIAELRLGRYEVVNDVINGMVDKAAEADYLVDDAVDAANYLRGLIAMEQDDLAAASGYLHAAVEGVGVHFTMYESGLAQLYQATGDLSRARELAEIVAYNRDAKSWRLSRELDIARGQLLLADILIGQGAVDDGRELAQDFLDRWQDADSDLPEMIRAREIIAEFGAIESR